MKKIEKFYERETTKKQYVGMLQAELEECFNMKEIQSAVRDIFNK